MFKNQMKKEVISSFLILNDCIAMNEWIKYEKNCVHYKKYI